jgi:hypothetical protein
MKRTIIVTILSCAAFWFDGCRPAGKQFEQKLRELRATMDTNAVAQILGRPPQEFIRTNSEGQAYKIWIYPIGACTEASIYFTPGGQYQKHGIIGG